jgi:hypothetical protein
MKKLSIRKNIIDELISTERSYVSSLNQLCEVFVEPLKTTKLISAEDYNIIFGGIQSIVQINREFLESSLEPLSSENAVRRDKTKRRLTETSAQVGRTFQKFAPIFAMYSKFVSTYETSANKLHELRKSKKKFQKFLDEQAKKKANGMSLESFLIMPIQRVPRYKMLLAELLKHTLNGRDDHNDLTIALERISTVAMKINGSIQLREETESMMNIHQSFNGTVEILKPARKLYKNIDVQVSSSNSKANKSPARLYVFNDVVIVGVPSNGGKTLAPPFTPYCPPFELLRKLDEEEMFLSDTKMCLTFDEGIESDEIIVEMKNKDEGIAVMDLMSSLALKNTIANIPKQRPTSTKTMMRQMASYGNLVSTQRLVSRRRKSSLKLVPHSSKLEMPPTGVSPPDDPKFVQRDVQALPPPPSIQPPPPGLPPPGPPSFTLLTKKSPITRPPGMSVTKVTRLPPKSVLGTQLPRGPPPPGPPPPKTKTPPGLKKKNIKPPPGLTSKRLGLPAALPPGIPQAKTKLPPPKRYTAKKSKMKMATPPPPLPPPPQPLSPSPSPSQLSAIPLGVPPPGVPLPPPPPSSNPTRPPGMSM